MYTVLLAAALLPAIVLLVHIYNKDKAEKEPIGLVLRVFMLGVAAGPVAAVIENVAFGLFELILPAGALLLVVEYFIGVAAVEEGVKYAALNTIRTNPEFNYVFDAVVYSTAAALGFAALENVFYVFDGGLEVALMRAVFSVPGHCADGAVMGCFFGMARHYEVLGDAARARRNYLCAFLLPVIEHGFYDAALSSESDVLALAAMAVEIAFMFVAIKMVNRLAADDKPLGGQRFDQAVPNVSPSYVAPSYGQAEAKPHAPETASDQVPSARPYAQAPLAQQGAQQAEAQEHGGPAVLRPSGGQAGEGAAPGGPQPPEPWS